ncbi:YfgM family protein [Marinobacter orientalis]|uniref:Ancillary SecYEG translocon subunit n=1 Tax=Marinobacter orientalis TaxID=1928859 RepID=A0A7Y0REP6_9GAMM|nr:tetratricopeptide repeat protein [Marinobacter orientalis]NMT64875.1 tetratricopeptide repeat protein [Marinobacter orientalis]TGX48863.1 tetratricopeptide repeat protein [Marinobacter orientalis]
MAEVRTEEETVQAIKDWWKKNGSSLLIGIAAALAIVFGWQAWQNHQMQQRTEAASQFADLINAYSDESDENRAETVAYVAQNLREEYSDSAFAIYGMLMLARQQMMDQDDPEAAIESLTWARENAEESGALALVIRNRLARAQFGAEQYDVALNTIESVDDTGSFSAIFSELKGDILLAQGNRDAARDAYLAARDQNQQGRSGILELKLSDLGVGEGD